MAWRLLILALALPGCIHAAMLGPGNYDVPVTHQQLARSYLMHIPPQAARGAAMPVVINFHGGGSNAQVEKSYTRMDASADRDGYVVVYPNGTSGIGNRFLTWNAGECCGPAAALGIDDVGFVLTMLDDVAARVRVDRTRIYATGLSNGSMMAYRLAAEASDRIAAVAGVAGAMSLQRFAPTRPMPVMHIHSTSDPIARYDGGLGPPWAFSETRMMHTAVEEMIARWTGYDSCPPKPARVEAISGRPGSLDDGHTAIKRIYGPCRDGVEVVLWQLGTAGHVWPGGIRDFNQQLLGTGTTIIDANTEMWKFFSRFRRLN